MPREFYIQPDAPDPVLSDAQALSLAREHCPQARAVTGIDETGGEARMYAIDDGLILKVQRPQQLRPSTSLKKEVLYLNQLEGVDGITVPKVLGYGHPEPLIEYTVMTRMPGIAVRDADLAGKPRQSMLRALGRMLRHLHSIPQEPLRTSGMLFGAQSPVDVRWWMGGLFDSLAEIIRDRGLPWDYPTAPDVVGRRAMRQLPDTWEIVALHSNPGPEHVFVDPDTGQLQGVIDFGDAYFNHPVHDLRRFRAPEDRAEVFAGYFENSSPSSEFLAVWDVACALADVAAIALCPEYRDSAAGELDRILGQAG